MYWHIGGKYELQALKKPNVRIVICYKRNRRPGNGGEGEMGRNGGVQDAFRRDRSFSPKSKSRAV
jgi:hypothetical protein